MEDNKILNLILDKVTNIDNRQEKLEQEFMSLKMEMTDFKMLTKRLLCTM